MAIEAEDPEKCSICREVKADGTALESLLCGHTFHKACLDACQAHSPGVARIDLRCALCRLSGIAVMGRMVHILPAQGPAAAAPDPRVQPRAARPVQPRAAHVLTDTEDDHAGEDLTEGEGYDDDDDAEPLELVHGEAVRAPLSEAEISWRRELTNLVLAQLVGGPLRGGIGP